MLLRWLFWLLFFPLRAPLYGLRLLGDAVRPCTTLRVRLRGALPDVAAGSGPFGGSSSPPLLRILNALSLAERDAKLRRVVVQLEELQLGLGRAEELRAALSRVRAAGKDVIVISEHLGLAGYWVGLGASKVVLSPTGSLDVMGVASEFTLLKGLLDKAGIRARLMARGEYKSMREMFAADEISAENREMLEALVSDLYAQLEERIATGRGIDASRVRGIVDQGPFRAQAALELGLVDELAYAFDLQQADKKNKKERSLGVGAYQRRRTRRFVPTRPPRVALLEVEGSIRGGSDSYGPRGKRATGSRSFVKAVARIAEDKRLAAIVLRVNSPGGSALASDVMWNALSKAKGDTPVFVSMGEVAASGGYYVSGVPGARIFANPSSITGSIGVVGGKMEVSQLLTRLGVGREFISVGDNADFHLPTRDWSEPQLKKMSDDIDALYTDFVTKMAEGRGMPFEQLEQVARGRVWTGSQAKERGLVDELGGLSEVMNAVRGELGLPAGAPLRLVSEGRPGVFKRLQQRLGDTGAAAWALPWRRLGAPARLLDDALSLADERLWARLPFDIDFK